MITQNTVKRWQGSLARRYMLRLPRTLHVNSRSSFVVLNPAIFHRTTYRTIMTGPLTDAIKEDHEEMYEYHDNYRKCAGDVDAQKRWSRQLIWEVARHAVAEEIVVYPLMEKHLGQKGKDLADKDRGDHQSVKEDLKRLEGITAGSGEFESILDRVMKHLHEHNNNEEVDDLPALESKLEQESSQAAAKSFQRTKMFVPTRAHPSAPNKPPYETLAGFLALPFDALKDAFSKFPNEDTKARTEAKGATTDL